MNMNVIITLGLVIMATYTIYAVTFGQLLFIG